MATPIFVVGAGFNIDASRYVSSLREKVSYPTVGDLATACFALANLPDTVSIEQLFQKSIDDRNRVPIERLCELLLKGDYYLSEAFDNPAQDLALYQHLLTAFPDSNFVSFNYDGLLDIMLLHRNEWRPDDGFGVPVGVEHHPNLDAHGIPRQSHRVVAHLHGSLYVYTQDYTFSAPDRGGTRWMERLADPLFLFDPNASGHRFSPFLRAHSSFVYEDVYERIIAPIPDKATALSAQFVQRSFARALQLVDAANSAVAVGYRFAPLDIDSYSPIVNRLVAQDKPLAVVAPDANATVARLTSTFAIRATPVPCTFAQWATNGFPLQ